jgi:hypothetical protein
MCNIIRNIRRMETDVVKRTNPTAPFNETMNATSRCRRGVQLQLRISDRNIKDVSWIRTSLLTTPRIRRSRHIYPQSKRVREDSLGGIQIGNGESRVVDPVEHEKPPSRIVLT